MKHGRAKAARKTLRFFSLNANIKPAYKVLLDGNFLAAAIKYKVPIIDRIGKTLQTNQFTFYVTRSALVELDNLPKDDENIFSRARQFGLDECEIIESSDIDCGDDTSESSPSQDIKNLVRDGNKNGFFIATQDKALSNALRDMIYVPQMWLTKGVLIFDTPSAASRRVSQSEERTKQKTGGGTMTPDESELIQRLRNEKRKKNISDNAKNGGGERRKRKAKGPNPLSCKKTKQKK